jgi:hypothetical protein
LVHSQENWKTGKKKKKDWLAARMGRLLTPCNLQGTNGIIESVFDDSGREIF